MIQQGNPLQQVYEQIFTILTTFPPLVPQQGGTLRTAFDETASNFQLSVKYGSGDKSVLRLKSMGGAFEPWMCNSRELTWPRNWGVLITTDWLQLNPLLDVEFCVACALYQSGDNLGLPNIAGGGQLQSWRMLDLRENWGAKTQPDKDADASEQWAMAAIIRTELVFDPQTVFKLVPVIS